ncbi:MAG: sigma 54-interacting transcriptional regulator [Kofleriaceae bacterium]
MPGMDEEVPLDALEPAPAATELLGASAGPTVRRFEVRGVDGPAAGTEWRSTGTTCAIGSHESNDVVLADTAASRFHCELRLERGVVRVHDLDSTNGTLLDGVPVTIGIVRDGSNLQIGRSTLRFTLGGDSYRVPASSRTQFGSLVGSSWAMRACFATLERVAPSDATVLLEGESGTGKEGTARALHDESPRKDGPFIVIDCGAIPGQLLESELFGHERGAFTGAHDRRIGAYEAAHGGTIFLDEIGELPTELQPKLLRVLEQREVRRVGATTPIKIDVRIVAATNRDLRAEVNAGRFRADLYFRLAVVKVGMPPLRARPDDLPLLVDHIVAGLDLPPAQAARLRDPVFVASLGRGAWPGNVRELRNYLERCAVLDTLGPTAPGDLAEPGEPQPYQQARDHVLAEFERRYVEQLLAVHGGNVSAAARTSGIDRTYFHRLMRRHNLTR